MGDLIKSVVGIFSGGAGAVVGNLATLVGVIAALTPLALFLRSPDSEAIFVSVTYREAAFWGGMIAVNLLVAWMTRRSTAG